MKRALGLVLLLAAVVAGEKSIVSFRIKGEERYPLRGWLLESDVVGFHFERFGGRRDYIEWDRLVEQDARALRRKLGLELSDDERLGLVPGHRLHLEGGGHVDGVLLRVDAEGRHWLQSAGIRLPYPGDRVARVEEIKVAEAGVYDEEEVYARRIERRRPGNAREHRALADRMYEIGNFERAAAHYEAAIERLPSLRAQLAPRLEELREAMEDEEVQAVLQKAKAASSLHGDHVRARAMLEDFIERNPDRKRAALRVLDEVEARRFEEQAQRFQRVKVEEFKVAVRDYVVRKAPTIDEAMSWVRAELEDVVLANVLARMGLTKEELKLLLEGSRSGSPHWAAYWTGSFILSNRAVTGKHDPRRIVGDKDRWWDMYGDVGPRVNFLLAYAAERLPNLFEVVQIKTPPCERCGGTGRIRHVSVRPVAGGGHEFQVRCHRCYGALKDRAVGYR